jgi:hypothetical protein
MTRRIKMGNLLTRLWELQLINYHITAATVEYLISVAKAQRQLLK